MKKSLNILAGALFLGSTACSMLPYAKHDEVSRDFLRKDDVAANYIKREDLGKYVAQAFKERFPDSIDGKYDTSSIFVDWDKYNISELVNSKETIEIEVIYKLDTTDNRKVLVTLTPLDVDSVDGILRGRINRIIKSMESNPEFKSELFKGNELYKEGNDYFYKMKFTGTATGIFDRYILTLEHIINGAIDFLPLPIVNDEGLALMLQSGPVLMEIPLDEVSRKYDLIVDGERKELDVIISNNNVDAALLKTEDYILKKSLNKLFYKVGNSDELRVGNWVMIAGKPLQMDDNTRFGTITNIKPVGASKVPVQNAKDKITKNVDYIFSISSPVVPGDSGSLVLAARDGKLEIVGFADAVIPHANINIITRSNSYFEVILSALVKDSPELVKTKEFQEFFENYLNSKKK